MQLVLQEEFASLSDFSSIDKELKEVSIEDTFEDIKDEELEEIIKSRAKEIVEHIHEDDKLHAVTADGTEINIGVGSFIDIGEANIKFKEVFSMQYKGKQIAEIVGVRDTKHRWNNKMLFNIWVQNSKEIGGTMSVPVYSSDLIRAFKSASEVIDNEFKKTYYKKVKAHDAKLSLIEIGKEKN